MCTALAGLEKIKVEIETRAAKDPALTGVLEAAAGTSLSGSIKDAEAFWKVFFPAGVGMMDKKDEVVEIPSRWPTP